jgi:hypothetical protein
MTMLEKLTRAIWTQLPQDDTNMATSGRIARAAREAIREPSEEVAAVAVYDEYDWAARNFTAMIDAILNEKTT